MKKFKFEIEMKVADMWVEDGFGPHCRKDVSRFTEQIEEALREQLLTFSTTSEFKISVKLVEHPGFSVVGELQGYSSSKKTTTL